MGLDNFKTDEESEQTVRAINSEGEIIEVPAEEIIDISEEELEELEQAIKEANEEAEEITSRPDVQRRGRLFDNHGIHEALLKCLGDAKCPVCGSDWRSLQWNCGEHEPLNIREARDMLHEELQDSIDRHIEAKNAGRIEEHIEKEKEKLEEDND